MYPSSRCFFTSFQRYYDFTADLFTRCRQSLVFPVPSFLPLRWCEQQTSKESVWREAGTPMRALLLPLPLLLLEPLQSMAALSRFFFKRGQVVLCITIKSLPLSPFFLSLSSHAHAHTHAFIHTNARALTRKYPILWALTKIL